MTKVLVTGSTGMLGYYVHSLLEQEGHEIVAPDIAACNLNEPAKVFEFATKIQPEAIIHLGAETDVDLCERDPRRAGLCNHLSTQELARAAEQTGAWMLYISTSNVFGSEGKLTYNEIDQPCSVNYYGRSKLFGEYGVQRYRAADSLILRAGWMIGGGPERDHKFVGKIIGQIKKGATQLRAVSDRFGTITPASQLAKAIVAGLKTRHTGLYHFASKGLLTRLDIARAIAATADFKGTVDSALSAEFPLSAPRPLFEGIESIYLGEQSGLPAPRAWQDDLADYVAEFIK